MIYKKRSEPVVLTMLEILNSRMVLDYKWRGRLLGRRSGHNGEFQLDGHTVDLGDKLLVLNDIKLATLDESTTFQIDTLIVSANAVFIYEVKNHRGSYYVENERYYNEWDKEILDPAYQIGKAGTYLRQLLKSMGFDFEVQAWVVFINPSFQLYQAPRSLPFLLAGQLPEHFQDLKKRATRYHPQQAALAQWLAKIHITKPRIDDLPEYDYDNLRKGITCSQCRSLDVFLQKYSCHCARCGFQEKTTFAIRRNIEEYRLLFPDRKVTTSEITTWCSVPSRQQVSRVLRKHYRLHGQTHAAHYTH